MRVLASILLGLVLVACGGGGGDSGGGGNVGDNYLDAPPLWNDYTLGLGETVNLQESVAVEFLGVDSDTRCPIGAQCAQGGSVRVRMRGITPRGATVVTLDTDQSTGLNRALFDYYGLTMRGVEPYPTADAQGIPVPIPPAQYEVTVFVTKNGEPPN